jgi:thymidine kinase
MFFERIENSEMYNETDFSGEIQLIIGPMFSGKSTELLRRIKRYEIAKKSCILVKHTIDNRYDQDFVTTHDLQKTRAISTESLEKIFDVLQNYQVIGIDEGQFFPDILVSEKLANQGKIVIIAALDSTFQRKPFNKICELIPLCEKVIKLNAVCTKCFKNASFTKRTTDEKEVEVVGGIEKYKPVCRKCFFE